MYSKLILISALITSCVPDVYIIDRHTVMEEEAAGDWPEFDKIFYQNVKTAGPTGFPEEPETKRKKRVKTVLNGELTLGKNNSSSKK